MFIESTVQLPISLAMFQDLFHSPDRDAFLRILFRWAHFVGGITWIGLLYFFNLVNVPVQKGLDPDTKKKVNPDLLGRALWYFRWGAVVTALSGLAYFAMYILKGRRRQCEYSGRRHAQPLVHTRCLADISDRSICHRVSPHQESAGVDERWTRVCGRDVYSGRDCDVGHRQVFQRHADGRRGKLCQQQGILDRRGWCVRRRHAAQCLGHHLAQQ